MQACLASSTIPYITERGKFSRLYRGRCSIDGGITNNTPIFPDGVRRQLVLRLSEVCIVFFLYKQFIAECIYE